MGEYLPSYNIPLEKKLAEGPIKLPGSPFWEVFRTFGRDEAIALVLNSAGTATLSALTVNPLLLALGGPIIEKGGFFAAYLKEAGEIYATTPLDQRKGKLHYVKEALRRGSASLGKDLVCHDPLYTSLVYYGLQAYPATPAWMLSIIGFGAAVGAVAIGQVAFSEARYRNQLRRFGHQGFKIEPYIESRFYIRDGNPHNILTDLSNVFELGTIKVGQYRDRYFDTKLGAYNFREPVVRLRRRNRIDGGYMQTAQVVYGRASAISPRRVDQFNYFPTRKDKIWFELKQEMPWEIADIENVTVRNLLSRITAGYSRDISFEREVAYDPETILASVDHVNPDSPDHYTVVEFKAYPTAKGQLRLIEAMRHVMGRYDVVQTTHGKHSLAVLSS